MNAVVIVKVFIGGKQNMRKQNKCYRITNISNRLKCSKMRQRITQCIRIFYN